MLIVTPDGVATDNLKGLAEFYEEGSLLFNGRPARTKFVELGLGQTDLSPNILDKTR